MLLINCYTCPQTKTKTIQAHEIVNNEVKRSYNKMNYDNITLFSNYDNVLLVNVGKASELKKVNFKPDYLIVIGRGGFYFGDNNYNLCLKSTKPGIDVHYTYIDSPQSFFSRRNFFERRNLIMYIFLIVKLPLPSKVHVL